MKFATAASPPRTKGFSAAALAALGTLGILLGIVACQSGAGVATGGADLARISHERPAAKPQAARMRRCKPISDIGVFQYAFSRKMGLRLASERPGASRDDLHEKCGLASHAGRLNLQVAMIPKGRHGRHIHRPMRPTHITVHSTQTYVPSADAAHFARALANGNLTATHNLLGYLTWHFTVDESSVYQHLPLNERGEHADYEGPGNRNSIGIEMCENRGNSREATVGRTAKLVAALMKEYRIPLSNVVPHQHWVQVRPRTGKNLGHKNCPHFLMDNGRPGAKWQGFLGQVERERRRL